MNCAHDIIHVGALGDDAGPAVDHRVEDRPSFIVGGVVGDDDLPREILTELVKSGLIDLNGHIHPPFGLPTGCKCHACLSAKSQVESLLFIWLTLRFSCGTRSGPSAATGC